MRVFLLGTIILALAGCDGKFSSAVLQSDSKDITRKSTPGDGGPPDNSLLKQFYGVYETVSFNGNPVITSEHFPAGLLDCGSESVIGNSRAVVTRQYPDRTEELRNTDYYDVQSGQGIVSEQIVLSAGVVNKACHLDGSTVFLDRGALTYGVSTAKFVFKGSVAIEDGAVKNMSEESEIVTLSSTDIRVSVTHSRQTNTYVLRKK